jgi:hypothetical protein
MPRAEEITVTSKTLYVLLSLTLAALPNAPSFAFETDLSDWESLYGTASDSSRHAGCQLCHLSPAGGNPWNPYGWDIRTARSDPSCGELREDGRVSSRDAITCVEGKNSDGDPDGADNLTEIRAGAQPGWTPEANNTVWALTGTATREQAPPDRIGPLDPGGSEPLPAGPAITASEQPIQRRALEGSPIIVVRAGESIQAAIDAALPGTTILIEPGIYRETGNAERTNALEISKSHIRLVGLSEPLAASMSDERPNPREATPTRDAEKGGTSPTRVVLKSTGSQRNGIVVVPGDRTECMGCHASLGPPFPLLPGVEPITETEPVLFDVEISGITIEGFPNNGLFTERLDGFQFADVWSIDNRNYGIFPTLSRNGTITRSRASGAHDSGIWVETSDNVQVTHSLMEGNVNGLEISNSDDIYAAYNEMRNNTIGVAVFVLQDALFAIRPDGNRYTIRRNWIHDNNKPNTATGGILATATPGTGIMALAMDESRFVENRIENHDAFGLVLADSCVVLDGTDYDCETAGVPDGFAGYLGSEIVENNRVLRNLFINNGGRPSPDTPHREAAGDIVFASALTAQSNCFAGNVYERMSVLANPPATEVPRPPPLPPAPCE